MYKFCRSILCGAVVSLFCSQLAANNDYLSLLSPEPESSLSGYAIGAVGLASLAGLVTYSLLPRQRFTLDASGIHDCRTGQQVAWRDVSSCQVADAQSSMPLVRLLGHEGQTCMTINQRDVELPCDVVADLITINILRSSEYHENQNERSAESLPLNGRSRNPNIVRVGICASLIALIWSGAVLAYKKETISNTAPLQLGDYEIGTKHLKSSRLTIPWENVLSKQIHIDVCKVDGQKKTVITLPKVAGDELTITLEKMNKSKRKKLLLSLQQLAAGREITEGKLDECVATDSGIVIADRGLIPWHTIADVIIEDVTKYLRKKRKITITCTDGTTITYIAQKTSASIDSLMLRIGMLRKLEKAYQVEQINGTTITLSRGEEVALRYKKMKILPSRAVNAHIVPCSAEVADPKTAEMVEKVTAFALYCGDWVYYVDALSLSQALMGKENLGDTTADTVVSVFMERFQAANDETSSGSSESGISD